MQDPKTFQMPDADELNYAYRMGEDYGKNGANTVNCHFSLFQHSLMKDAWERGRDSVPLRQRKGTQPAMHLITYIERMMLVNNQETGRLARAERIKQNCTLRYVAKVMGVSPSFLSDLELGRRNWLEKHVAKFNKAIRRG